MFTLCREKKCIWYFLNQLLYMLKVFYYCRLTVSLGLRLWVAGLCCRATVSSTAGTRPRWWRSWGTSATTPTTTSPSSTPTSSTLIRYIHNTTSNRHSRVEWFSTFLQFSKLDTLLLITDQVYLYELKSTKSANLAARLCVADAMAKFSFSKNYRDLKNYLFFSDTFRLLLRTKKKIWR